MCNVMVFWVLLVNYIRVFYVNKPYYFVLIFKISAVCISAVFVKQHPRITNTFVFPLRHAGNSSPAYQESFAHDFCHSQRQSNNSLKLLITKEIQTREEPTEENDLTPVQGSSTATNTFEAYYENPGILMIVQSIEDDSKGEYQVRVYA